MHILTRKNLFVFFSGIKIILLSTGVFAQPSITSFSPTSGPIGTTVTIFGNNFDPNPTNNIVYFGAVKGNISAASANSLTVKVPIGASYQPISVTVNGYIASTTFPFTLTYSGGGAITSTSYDTKKSFSTGIFPQVVSSGDLDSDGKPDMVTPNTTSNSISILRNTSSSGIISFAAKLDYATGPAPSNVSIADLDGDGKLDIAVLNATSNTVSVYKNTSNNAISFAVKIDFPTGPSPFGIAIADFDGDGKQDIAVSNYGNNSVSVLKNNGTPGNISFAAKLDFLIGANPYTITAGDVDGDSKTDLVSTDNQSNSISILRNTSNTNGISFAPRIGIATNSKPSTAIIADFDGDGKQDIAVGSDGVASVSVYRNLSGIGNISLAPKIDYATAGITYGISAGDLNGDGKPDIISGFSTSTTISVIENTSTSGALSFKQQVNYSSDSGPFYVIIQDVDGDGVNDFVSANANSNSISVFRNKLNPSLVPTISSFTPTSATSGTLVTINGNNFTGVTAVSFGGIAASSFTVTSSNTIQAVVSNGASGNVSVTTSNGTATLAGFIYYAIPVVSSFTPLAGPIGTTVVISGNNFNPVLSNNVVYFGGVKANIISVSTTALTVTVPPGATYQPIIVTDITTNLSAYSKSPFLVTFSSNGIIDANSFATKVDIATAATSIDCFLGDVDNDGQLDLAIANVNGNFFSLFRNTSSTGNISFGSEKNYITGRFPSKAVLADLNGDGKLDIVTSSLAPDSIYIYKNTSVAGTFSLNLETSYPTGLDPQYIAIHDLNADGKPDMVIANYNSKTISVFKNISVNGNISFLNIADYSTGNLLPRSIAIGDIDGDGKPDISVA
ncbi:MAG: VCBS repeat-containing protein, partial [Chitinophagaceae bacterium]|nr:VCBS repeat-containing protein [Chitinophagaceae bacterium]